jgi:hypothetical protein
MQSPTGFFARKIPRGNRSGFAADETRHPRADWVRLLCKSLAGGAALRLPIVEPTCRTGGKAIRNHAGLARMWQAGEAPEPVYFR